MVTFKKTLTIWLKPSGHCVFVVVEGGLGVRKAVGTVTAELSVSS